MSEQKKLVAVCGATGEQGRSVLRYLVESGSYRVRALTRDPSADKATKLKIFGNDVELWKCDMTNSDDVIKAFQGCWGAFCLTDFWSNPEKMVKEEERYGRILIDAAVKANVEFCIWSSLHDVATISDNKLDVPHFTNKNKVEQYARNEFKGRNIKTKFGFVYPAFYLQNLLYFFKVKLDPNDSSTLVWGPLPVKQDTLVPVINIEEFGRFVLAMFDGPDQFANKQVYAANEYITFPRLLELITNQLGLNPRYEYVNHDQFFQITQSNELVHMFRYFNEYGYYNKEDITDSQRIAKDLKTLEQAVKDLPWQKTIG